MKFFAKNTLDQNLKIKLAINVCFKDVFIIIVIRNKHHQNLF